jgi:hypothetical protein
VAPPQPHLLAEVVVAAPLQQFLAQMKEQNALLIMIVVPVTGLVVTILGDIRDALISMDLNALVIPCTTRVCLLLLVVLVVIVALIKISAWDGLRVA